MTDPPALIWEDWMRPPTYVIESRGLVVPRAPRAPQSPLVVHVPHAATEIPDDVRSDLLLDDEGLEAELAAMTDWHTDRLARDALDRAGTPAALFRNLLSRLVIDPERFADEREVMLDRGMGAVYLSTSTLEPLRRTPDEVDRSPYPRPEPRGQETLLERFFFPYALRLSHLVADTLLAFDRCVLVDVHSYPSVALPYELDPTAPRPGVCVGTDPFHTPPALRDGAIDAFTGVPGGVAVNTPFAGSYVPFGFYGADERVTSVMIEIRRDLYLHEPATLEPEVDPAGFADLADRLGGLFRTLVP